jgi:iron complex outermembrane recepter protein
MTRRTKTRRIRLLRAIVAGIVSATIASAALAQDRTAGEHAAGVADEPAGQLESVVVTSSRIRRTELESVVPITVVGEEAIEVRNAVLPVDLLTSLP